jgi:hypothetical protein
MKRIFLGTSALIIACFLNLKYAVNDYGVIDNEQHACVLAQSNSSGGGTTGGGTSGGGTSGGGTSGGGICKQNHVPKKEWNETIVVNGVSVQCKWKESWNCTTNGNKSTCKTGGIYWNANNVEVYNSVQPVTSCQ